MVNTRRILVFWALQTVRIDPVYGQDTGITVQNDWVLPYRPDKADYFLNGNKITIEWTRNLWTWFESYAPEVDPTECDLWVTGWELHQYEYQVARRVNAQVRTSIDWVIGLPSADLEATEWWVFRFIQVNSNTTLEGSSISSPGFGVREQTVPSPTSSPPETSSTTETTSSSTRLDPTSASEAAASSTTTQSSGADISDAPGQNAGLSTGSKAGIGVGAAAGALILVAAGWFFGRKMRSNKQTPHEGQQNQEYKPPLSDLQNRSWGANGPLPAYAAPSTSPGETRYVELETPQHTRISELGSDR